MAADCRKSSVCRQLICHLRLWALLCLLAGQPALSQNPAWAEALAEPVETKELVTRADLLVVMPTSLDRSLLLILPLLSCLGYALAVAISLDYVTHIIWQALKHFLQLPVTHVFEHPLPACALRRLSLVDASRRWRRGVRTFIVADKVLPFQLQEKFRLHRETWATFQDNTASKLDIGARSGDLRAAMAPFLANETFGVDNYKWILYGDDDTVMFIDNVLALVNKLDHDFPYLISDCLWWPQGGSGTKLHPNREAPRCLPCNWDDHDDLLAHGGCPGHSGFLAPLGCPCSPNLIFANGWADGDPVFPDGRGIFNRTAVPPDFIHRPGSMHSPYIGWWYMIHGGAGALISSAAMRRAPLERVTWFYSLYPVQSGDALLSRAFWSVLGLAPTDPGYGFCRRHIQMFDPGFRGGRSRGKEDVGTADAGADPVGVLTRSRHVAEDLFEDDPSQITPEDGFPKFRAAGHLINRLAILGEQFHAKRKGTSHFIPLWQQ